MEKYVVKRRNPEDYANIVDKKIIPVDADWGRIAKVVVKKRKFVEDTNPKLDIEV
jgi:hypothetical protein